jgi:hypothetical protein
MYKQNWFNVRICRLEICFGENGDKAPLVVIAMGTLPRDYQFRDEIGVFSID